MTLSGSYALWAIAIAAWTLAIVKVFDMIERRRFDRDLAATAERQAKAATAIAELGGADLGPKLEVADVEPLRPQPTSDDEAGSRKSRDS